MSAMHTELNWSSKDEMCLPCTRRLAECHQYVTQALAIIADVMQIPDLMQMQIQR